MTLRLDRTGRDPEIDLLQRVLESDMEAHRSRDSRAALRAGLGTATTVIDLARNRLEAGPKNAITRAQMRALQDVSDEIWRLRAQVTVPNQGENS